MQPLSAFELLRLWEWGQGQTPLRRGLGLLAAACPDEELATLAQLPIGERDARLLTLREWSFGRDLTALVDCPRCHEPLELSFRTDEIRTAPAMTDQLVLENAGYRVWFRLPNTLDVEAALTAGQEGHAVLLQRCVLGTQRLDGEPVPVPEAPVDALPAAAAAAIMAAIEAADPQAKLTFAVTCFSCGYPWQALFDIVSFFWNEINVWAMRMLAEVHALASAYHWREADILALSPWRRQAYLQLLGAA